MVMAMMMAMMVELKDLKEMLDGGLLTQEEFNGLKERLLRGE